MLHPAQSRMLMAAAITLVPITHAAAVTAKKVKKPAPKASISHTVIGVKGTHQMAGGDGAFGQTYTVTDGGGYGPVNFTIKDAAYSVERINMAPGNTYAPKAGEKLLVIHYRVKNPNTADLYYSGGHLFQTVTANNATADDSGDSRRESEKDKVAYTMKPGQGIDDLVTYAVLPAGGALPKLILKMGQAGTKELVTRYMLGAAANKVKPIPAPYADPADPSGATALAEIPGQIGTSYVAGFFDLSVDSVAFAPGPFGDTAPGDGKRFLVVTVTATNKAWDRIYVKYLLAATLVTSDDEKTTDYVALKAKRDETFDGEQVEAGESKTLRFLFQVPNDTTAKKLTIAEVLDNTGSVSKALVYDLSAVK